LTFKSIGFMSGPTTIELKSRKFKNSSSLSSAVTTTRTLN